MNKPETRLRKQIKQSLIEEVGGRWTHIHGDPYQERGVSDLLGCVKGYFIAIEVKMPDGKLATKPQLNYLDEITKNGGLGFVSDSVEYTISTVKTWLKSKVKAAGGVKHEGRGGPVSDIRGCRKVRV